MWAMEGLPPAIGTESLRGICCGSKPRYLRPLVLVELARMPAHLVLAASRCLSFMPKSSCQPESLESTHSSGGVCLGALTGHDPVSYSCFRAGRLRSER